jgi:redox-sensitive bicupin YhaK (pirin superfamily)
MIRHHPAARRFLTRIDWLESWHAFSFGEHYDPARLGFGALRVLNDDRIAPGAGFPTHGHRDMEILTWVLEGAVAHRDSSGGEGEIRPGELQRMRAGRGIRHSEFNPSPTQPLHLLQIWLAPLAAGLAPGYAQRGFPAESRRNRFQLLADRSGHDGALDVVSDAALLVADLAPGGRCARPLAPGRRGWLHVARGSVTVGGQALAAGDALELVHEPGVEVAAAADAQVLLFDLG